MFTLCTLNEFVFVFPCLVLSNAFSTGYRFNYWGQAGRRTDFRHDGEVSPYYNSIKEEILHSGWIHIKVWYEMINKAQMYFQTNKAKHMKTNPRRSHHQWHDIKPESKIRLEHLVAIIAYCDYSNLSTDFSSSFRQKDPFETIQSVIDRNSKYFYFSKLLSEAVCD